MARWPMAALLASVAPIGRHQSDVRGMPRAWNRSAAADLMVGGGLEATVYASQIDAELAARPQGVGRRRM